MSTLSILAIGIFVVAVAVGILTARIKKAAYDYDERQLMAQGRAYMWGFFTIFTYTVLYPLVTMVAGRELMETDVALFLGIELGLAVFSVYCIWKDAYFDVHSTRTLTGVVLVTLTQGAFGIPAALDGNLVVDGKLSFSALHLSIFILCLIILGNYGLKKALTRREEDE